MHPDRTIRASVDEIRVSPQDYFYSLSRRVLDAEKRSDEIIERYYEIRGHLIRFRFSGTALVPRLTPALAHLSVPPAQRVDLSVSLWDSVSTGVSMLPPPWNDDELRVNGEIPSFISAGLYTHYNVYHNALTIFDEKGENGIFWIKNAEDVPDHETASPLFALFHSWLSKRGLVHVHAGAVGLPDGGALLVGDCGSGKSNTGLSCLDSELFYAGDDRCLVGSRPEPFVQSIYSTAKTHPEDIDRFPFLARHREKLSYLENGKLLFFLDVLFPGKMITGFPLRVIIMPRVTGLRDTTVEAGSPARGLLTLAPDTSIRWPSTGPTTFSTLSTLFRTVPCYQLNVGTDISQIPEAILELLKNP
ncbi:MAG: hypothetical protein IH951_01820 [Bacteroidetes bacterium]|nr:hypothetical protein [Bacteroidota bacterium]